VCIADFALKNAKLMAYNTKPRLVARVKPLHLSAQIIFFGGLKPRFK
jgi:hypothetical protein